MASGQTEERELELKYCERCGCLGMRPKGGDQIYCGICAKAMARVARSRHESPPAGGGADVIRKQCALPSAAETRRDAGGRS